MIATIMEFATWLKGYLFGKRSKVVGKHWKHTIQIVPITYHPMPELCGYPALWEARVSGRVDYLRAPLKALYALAWVGKEIDRIMRLNDYRWAVVDIEEWPESWKEVYWNWTSMKM